jgi:ABC-type sugar transport system ATPase subunit
MFQPTAGVEVGAKAELHRLIHLAVAEGAAVLSFPTISTNCLGFRTTSS